MSTDGAAAAEGRLSLAETGGAEGIAAAGGRLFPAKTGGAEGIAGGIEARFKIAYPGFTLDVHLQLPARGVTALFGHSGSGKTSCLRAMAGLERAPGGYFAVGGDVWQDEAQGIFLPTHRRALGYVFQEASLFPHLSVRRNLEYGMRRVNAARNGVDFAHAVDLLGIEPLLDRSPDRLSGGERQRAAIARALLTSPRLLLLDEPLAALDLKRKAEILPYLERLHGELDIPMVYVSHSLEEVTRLADHMILMVNGRAAAQGAVYDVMARLDLFPFAEFSEGGAVILMQVESHLPRHALTRLAFAGGTLVVPEIPVAAGEHVRVRLKAADVMLSLAEPDRTISANNVLKAVVTEVRQDAGAYADVQLACGDTRLISRITRLSAERLALRPGLEVFAIIKAVSVNHRALGGGVTM